MGADLITLDEYKVSEKIESLKHDTRIESLIPFVSQLVKTYCSNSFVDYFNTDKVETFDVDYAMSRILLSESPLVSVSKVEERENFTNAYVELTADADYYLDFRTDSVARTNDVGYSSWYTGPGAVKITYRAGYDSSNIPGDIKLAVIDIVKYYMEDEHKKHRTIRGTSMSNEGTSTQWRDVGFPDHIKRVLDLYRQIQP